MNTPNPMTWRSRMEAIIHLTCRHSAGLSARWSCFRRPTGGATSVMVIVTLLLGGGLGRPEIGAGAFDAYPTQLHSLRNKQEAPMAIRRLSWTYVEAARSAGRQR